MSTTRGGGAQRFGNMLLEFEMPESMDNGAMNTVEKILDMRDVQLQFDVETGQPLSEWTRYDCNGLSLSLQPSRLPRARPSWPAISVASPRTIPRPHTPTPWRRPRRSNDADVSGRKASGHAGSQDRTEDERATCSPSPPADRYRPPRSRGPRPSTFWVPREVLLHTVPNTSPRRSRTPPRGRKLTAR